MAGGIRYVDKMTTRQRAEDERWRRQHQHQQSFQRCHLQILRSLYNDDDDGGCGRRSEKGINDNCIEQDHTDGNDTNENINYSEKEGPVSSEVWELIDRFLQQRREYLPQLQRQMHWNEIVAEASSRRNHVISKSFEEEQQQVALSRAPSLTPRNLAFSAVKRRSLSTPNNHNNLSLTPVTNNRNAMTSRSNNNSHGLTEVSIPSWNFISRMVKQRQEACTKSCDAFRSEPFLQSLLHEAKARCKVLEVSLQSLKDGIAVNIDHNGKKRGCTATFCSATKRVKFEDIPPEMCVTGISFFERSEPLHEMIDPDECNQINYSDSSMQRQIKLNLWMSLSKSVEDIIDVG